jgi:hypothetical protein
VPAGQWARPAPMRRLGAGAEEGSATAAAHPQHRPAPPAAGLPPSARPAPPVAQAALHHTAARELSLQNCPQSAQHCTCVHVLCDSAAAQKLLRQSAASPGTVVASADMTPASTSCSIGHSRLARSWLRSVIVSSSSRDSCAVCRQQNVMFATGRQCNYYGCCPGRHIKLCLAVRCRAGCSGACVSLPPQH